jgi:hypothetical protein
MATAAPHGIRREVALPLLAAWLTSWAAEERALSCAERDHMLSSGEIRRHRETMRHEREQVGRLLR